MGIIWNTSEENRAHIASKEHEVCGVFSGERFFSFEVVMDINADNLSI